MTGRLILAATPIGNIGDASPRLREALETADVVAAEDTRRVRDLARRLGAAIPGTVVAVHEHTESDRARSLIDRAVAGETVLCVTDAGTPGISDPGYRLVREALSREVDVTVLPGPSAVTAALILSGLPSDRFCFEGFPSRGAQRARAFSDLASEPRTMVFFESPRRTASTLGDMEKAFGSERQAAVVREMTKTHEETVRGTLGELAAWAASREVLGEVVLVVAGAPPGLDLAALADEAEERVRMGERLKDVVLDLARTTGAGSRDLYREVLVRRSAAP